MNRTGCLMLSLENYEFSEIDDQFDIDDTYVHEEGWEKDPHITVIYGIDVDKFPIEEVIPALKAKLEEEGLMDKIVNANEADCFTPKEYDVLKLDFIKSGTLDTITRLNSWIANKYDVVSDFDKYIPHCTIVYLQKGYGKQYERTLQRVYPIRIIGANFSYKEGPEGKKHRTIRLL
jgi:2'-5' RNA ligase